MSEMPERVYLYDAGTNGGKYWSPVSNFTTADQEYVRADAVEAQIAELESRIRQLESQAWLDTWREDRFKQLNADMAELAKWKFGPNSLEWSWVQCAIDSGRQIAELTAALAEREKALEMFEDRAWRLDHCRGLAVQLYPSLEHDFERMMNKSATPATEMKR